MKGPLARLVRKLGLEYDVLNADRVGGRDVPTYESDGAITATLERRGQPLVVTESDGTDVETDLEVRAILDDDGPEIRDAGSTDGPPTLLEHPNGRQYRVLHRHDEDSGVVVLAVTED